MSTEPENKALVSVQVGSDLRLIRIDFPNKAALSRFCRDVSNPTSNTKEIIVRLAQIHGIRILDREFELA